MDHSAATGFGPFNLPTCALLTKRRDHSHWSLVDTLFLGGGHVKLTLSLDLILELYLVYTWNTCSSWPWLLGILTVCDGLTVYIVNQIYTQFLAL